MKREKIDSRLSEVISIFNSEEKVECLIRALNQKSYELYIKHFSDKVIKELPFILSFSASLTKKEIAKLSRNDNIVYISAMSNVFALMNVAKKILKVPPLKFGKGQTICFIDTGLNPHCDFMLCEKRIKAFVDFIGEEKELYDDNGHGTFVAGVCCGGGQLSGGKLSGIAPKSNIISLKALIKKGKQIQRRFWKQCNGFLIINKNTTYQLFV